MNSTLKLVSTAVLSAGILTAATTATAQTVEGRYVYVGAELGISPPLADHLDVKNEFGKTRIELKRSRMYGGKIGYSFYPNMAVEVSGTYQPKYGLKYKLPETTTKVPLPAALGGAVVDGTIPQTSGETDVSAKVFTANLIYKFDSVDLAGIKPYVIGGIGLAMVDVKSTSSSAVISLPGGAATPNTTFFKVRNTKTNCLAYQAGIGLSKEIGKNLEVDASAKIQIVQGIKINYDVLDGAQQKFIAKKPIKETIGVGEFALGFTYKLGL